MPKKVNFIITTFILTSVAVYALAGFIIYSETKPQYLEFYVFDIGQGDSILIKTPSGHKILVDGGPDNSVVYKLGKFLPFYQREIDYLILTHADADHVVGLLEVLRRYEVKNIIATSFVHNSSYFREWQSRLGQHNVLVADGPKVLQLGEAELFFIHPSTPLLGKNVNDSSIVFKLQYRDFKALFMGDFENEETFVGGKFNVRADFLKVGHHGAENASDFDFLRQVNPDMAAISAGRENKFGHPKPATLDGLEKVGAIVYRTDLLGDLKFVYTGNGLEYQP